MRISAPRLVEKNELIRYSVDIVSEHMATSKLYYELDKSYSDMVSDASDAALVGLLIPAMFYGEDIYLEGKVSEELYFNISHKLQVLLKNIMPFLKIIKISVNITVPSKMDNKSEKCATGFSGGIDSFCTLADYFYGIAQPHTLRISTLFFNNTGSHNHGLDTQKLFMQRYERLKCITDEIGLPLVKIDSNLDDFYIDKKLFFGQTHTIRNASVASLMQKGVGRYFYSSGYDYSKLTLTEKTEAAHSDFAVLEILSTDKIRLHSVGSEYNRVEKTEIVSKITDSYKYIDVCSYDSREKTNCSKCGKCMRTLATLEMLGALELYTDAFDLDVYKKHRNRFLGKVLAKNSIYTREISDLARNANFMFPVISYIYGAYYKLRYLMKKK